MDPKETQEDDDYSMSDLEGAEDDSLDNYDPEEEREIDFPYVPGDPFW
jgi:hypothetical protein